MGEDVMLRNSYHFCDYTGIQEKSRDENRQRKLTNLSNLLI